MLVVSIANIIEDFHTIFIFSYSTELNTGSLIVSHFCEVLWSFLRTLLEIEKLERSHVRTWQY